MKPPENSKELERLRAVQSYEILDTAAESDFDDLVRMAGKLFKVPISTVTILDEHRQWFKASIGLPVKETARDISFCTHAIEMREPLVVADTKSDPRFKDNPLVQGAPNLVFYAGVPIIDKNDHAIGTSCIMDKYPRILSKNELELLKIFANQAMMLLEVQFQRDQICDLLAELDSLNEQLKLNERG